VYRCIGLSKLHHAKEHGHPIYPIVESYEALGNQASHPVDDRDYSMRFAGGVPPNGVAYGGNIDRIRWVHHANSPWFISSTACVQQRGWVGWGQKRPWRILE
jgi:hypothetical protein